MKKTIVALFLLIQCACVWAQGNIERPALVVGVTVDGLREDYLQLFWNACKAGGFRRIYTTGAQLEQCSYDYRMAGDLTDLVTLTTGADPYLHGIASDKVFDRKTQKYSPVLEDKGAAATQGGTRVSGRAIKATTWADELYENTIGMSKQVSIAVDPQFACAGAGHAGMSLWVDNLSGRWVGSTYYQSQLPAWAQNQAVGKYLDKTWTPLYPISTYEAATSRSVGFSYQLRAACNDVKIYDNFFTTPYANTAVREMAVKAIDGEKLGQDMTTDVLSVHFSIRTFVMDNARGVSVELEDAYLRLDQELDVLMKALDAKVGKGNWLLYFTTTRTAQDYSNALNTRLPVQSFNAERYSGLLNSYLCAKLGQAKWVLGHQWGRIFLNRSLIEDKGLVLSEVQAKAVEFYALIPGVLDMSTSYELERGYVSGGATRYAYTKEGGADLYYTLAPGWYEVDMKGRKTGYRSSYNQRCRLAVLGWKVPVVQVSAPVSVRGLAPTIASWLHLGTPSGSQAEVYPIPLTK